MLLDIYSDALKRAQERTLDSLSLLKLAGQLAGTGQNHLVTVLYQVWIEHNGDSPLIHAIYFNYGVVLTNMGDTEGAIRAFKKAIEIAPAFFPPYINLGGSLDRVGRTGDAVATWSKVVNLLPVMTGDNLNYKVSALKQIGRVLERHNFDEQAEASLQQALDLDQSQWDVAQHWLSLRQRQCKWPVVKPWGKLDHKALMNGFSALTLSAHTDDPLLLLGNAYRYCKNHIGQPKKSFAEHHFERRHKPREGRLKIGYLSSDLREHAIGFLTAEIYGLHDRAKVETFSYYCGIKSNDRTHHRIKDSSEHWCDLNGMTDEQAAQRVFDDGIDILVDVNGYTNGAMTKMLAMRPAPITVNWLGFPGTMGSPYHDYIIADDFVLPPENEIHFSEKVVRLPCYQPNDRFREVSDKPVTRLEAGLPEDAMVYCCFNGLHKISQHAWQRWLSILREVPNSVLWLLDGHESANKRLREMFVEAGFATERLIFAPKKTNAEHLARYVLADLFLDTSPYGAHTTSSDALWMGVPIITLSGRSFASRVSGSLLHAAGLKELVCDTPEQFFSLGVALGRDSSKRNEFRRRLKETRDTCLLFDTPRLVAGLEDLYRRMWEDFRNGQVPYPDLRNLEIYNDIGIELAEEDRELLTVRNYRELYEEKLAEKDAFWHLPADSRLWTEEAQRRLRKG